MNKGNYNATSGRFLKNTEIQKWMLRPASFAKTQPECVPLPIVIDYYEACSIRDLSPKASATLSRRCLQGMIRDFCQISSRTLYGEIQALKAAVENGGAPAGVSEDSIDAIDAVRSIGNIGAHMEADINIIVDVDAGEAQALIELIELLIEDWYVARDKRQKALRRVQRIAAEKNLAKQNPPLLLAELGKQPSE